MPAHDLSRFVRIARPDGTPLGSGFRLSPRRVLTAWHVVKGEARIRVLEPAAAHWTPVPASVVWPGIRVGSALRGHPGGGGGGDQIPESGKGETSQDATLLETDPVGDGAAWTRFLEARLTETVEWEGFGFPGFCKEPAGRHLLKGTVAAFDSAEEEFQVTVREGLPKRTATWKGMSGAPVLVLDRQSRAWTLAGVLRVGRTEGRGARAAEPAGGGGRAAGGW